MYRLNGKREPVKNMFFDYYEVSIEEALKKQEEKR